ncbi:MAG TPA: Mur ligase family protein, partial [Spirochaetia bacterium]|nr:Mur ligase family protein [Spirochaetia bacterium]
MIAKRLSEFTSTITINRRIGGVDPLIRGIAYDSRMASAGSLFFALGGIHTDGFLFIDGAIERGAAAIVCSRAPERPHEGIVYLVVDDPRRVMSPIAAEFYGHPSRKLKVIGVTGTDGKSTTVFLAHQLIEKLGKASGFLSTVQIKTGENIGKNRYRQSTPEASEIHAILAEMVDQGKEFAVIEATSHGLSERTGRLADVRFSGGVMTNVTHEHLEFHGSFEQYRSDKANLFRALEGEGAFGVVNCEDASSDLFRR